MRLLLLLLACGLPLVTTTAQKFIQLEKSNRARTIKFYVGQELTYRLKGENEWFTSTITDVRMETQMVSFDLKPVPVSDIEAIRLQYPGILRALGPSFMVFGASWAGFSLIGAVFDDYQLTAGTAIVSGTGLASGFILQRIFRNKRVKMSERRRLRAVEIPVTPISGGR